MPQASRLYKFIPGTDSRTLRDRRRLPSIALGRKTGRAISREGVVINRKQNPPWRPARLIQLITWDIANSPSWSYRKIGGWVPVVPFSWQSDTLGNAAHTLGSAGSVVSGAQGSSGDRERGLTKARTRRCRRSTAWPTTAPSGQFVSARCSSTQLAKVACCGWQAGKRYGGGVAAKLLNWAVCLRLDAG
jgi:hypothetical protein